MMSVAVERERIRARERAAAKVKGATLRHEHKRYMKEFVERLSLSKWLNTEDAKMRLASAGFRGPQAEDVYKRQIFCWRCICGCRSRRSVCM